MKEQSLNNKANRYLLYSSADDIHFLLGVQGEKGTFREEKEYH